MSTTALILSFPTPLAQWLEDHAADRGVAMATIVEEALTVYQHQWRGWDDASEAAYTAPPRRWRHTERHARRTP